jgi:hypothetical protein
MTVFVSSGTEIVAGKQIFLVNYEAEVSQRLVDASHNNDLKSAYACIADSFVDVNFMGTVSLKARKTETVLHEESAHKVLVEYEEFKTEVNALFLAAHTGNLKLVRMLLVIYLINISPYFDLCFLVIMKFNYANHNKVGIVFCFIYFTVFL